MQHVVLAWALLASCAAHAQSLVAGNSGASTYQANAPITLAYTPGADSGSFDFDLRYTTLATTSVAQVDSTIPNGALACSSPAPRQLRCSVLAVSGATDLGAGNITVAFTTGATPGTMPVTFASTHFFAQTGAPEAGTTTAGSLVLTTSPTLSIADVSTVEGNTGTTTATFTVSLAPAAAGPVAFDITTDTGTATPGVDYVAKSQVGQVIPAGQSSATFTVTINGDTVVEDDETFAVQLAHVSGAVVSRGHAIGRIANDDSAGLSISDASVAEGNAGTVTVRFQVSLSAPMPTPVTFDIATSNGTATAGSDYVALSQPGRVLDAGRTTAVFEVAVKGDALAEPDESFTVTLGNVTGAGVVDGAATGTIVNDDGSTLTAIAQIQGTGPVSPLRGRTVSTEGIVTAVTADGFYLQADDASQDGDPASAEGIVVASHEGGIAVGDRRRVDGVVQEVQDDTRADQLTLTRIAATRTVLLARGQRLPAPVALGASEANPDGPLTALERFEAMRVAVATLDVVGPSTGRVDAITGAFRGTGKFVGVVRGIPRPFLEPGIEPLARDTGAAISAPRFDGNPERLRVDSAAQRGAPILSADAGDTVNGLVGVLGYADGAYQLLPDPEARVAVASGARPRAVAASAPGDATIGAITLRDWVDDTRSGSEPVASAEAYALRLAKAANAICAYAGAPDVLAVTGVEHRAALVDLANAVNANDGNLLFPGSCSGNPRYAAYMVADASAPGGGLGFLVRGASGRDGMPRVAITSFAQTGASARLRRPDGSTEALHARPPLMLEALVQADDGRRIPVTVIAAGLSPLDDAPDAPGRHGWRTRAEGDRARRLAQAAWLGRMLRDRLRDRPDERLVVLGDFEASEFGDGRGDLLGLVAGTAASSRARGGDAGAAPTRLRNLTTQMPAGERYTVVRDGNAQAVDHVLVSAALLAAFPRARLEAARIDADFGEDSASDPGVPMRVSDHDPVVLYLELP